VLITQVHVYNGSNEAWETMSNRSNRSTSKRSTMQNVATCQGKKLTFSNAKMTKVAINVSSTNIQVTKQFNNKL